MPTNNWDRKHNKNLIYITKFLVKVTMFLLITMSAMSESRKTPFHIRLNKHRNDTKNPNVIEPRLP